MRDRTTQRVNQLGGPLEPLQIQIRSLHGCPIRKRRLWWEFELTRTGSSNVFDGQSLRQWSGDKKYWSVKDGALTGVTDGSLKMNHFMTWKPSTIRNFDLRVKVKISGGGNSGIQYRGTSRPDLGLDVVTGYQCDVVAKKPELQRDVVRRERSSDSCPTPAKKSLSPRMDNLGSSASMPVKEFPADQWHDYRVLVRGNHHQHWIDDHMTADLIDLDIRTVASLRVCWRFRFTSAPRWRFSSRTFGSSTCRMTCHWKKSKIIRFRLTQSVSARKVACPRTGNRRFTASNDRF